MNAAWEYLNRVAEDAADYNWNGITHSNGRKCQSATREGCREKHGSKNGDGKQHVYSAVVGGVNSFHEKMETTAISFEDALNNFRFRGANQRPKFKSQVWAKDFSIDGVRLPGNDIILGDETRGSDKINRIGRRLSALAGSGGSDSDHVRGGGSVGNDKGNHGESSPERGNDIPAALSGQSGNGGGGTADDDGESSGKLTQTEFQFDEAKGKVLDYLEACAEDAWVESGTGNLVWKKPKRKTPFDRLPKRRIHEIIADNVSLIKTIDKKMFPDVSARIYRVLAGRLKPENFVKWLTERCGVSRARAYLIATDQFRKVKELMKIEDWMNRGIEFAVWRHKENEVDPREYHLRKWDGKSGIRSGKPNGLDGFVFRLDTPPVIDRKTGERGYPGSLVGCRCYITGVRT